MKNFSIIVLLLTVKINIFAQITSEISYDYAKRTVTWTITNNFDKKVQLVPSHGIYIGPGCWFKTKFKDKNKKDISEIFGYTDGVFISPKSSRSFKLYLYTEDKNAKSVEIFFHEEVYIVEGLKMKVWKGKEFTRTYDL